MVVTDSTTATLGFIYRYEPADAKAGSTTLLLLHGTGGDENDLIPLGRALLPGAGMLSPRGKVLEGGAPRFFRRIREGVFDQEDLARRTEELAQFIDAAAAKYDLDKEHIIAVGFSNGANIAGGLLLRRADVLRKAVLLSPMVPFEPDPLPDLSETSVFIGAGRADPLVSLEQVDRLADLLRRAGAAATLHWTPGGHAISEDEVDAARRWISHVAGSERAPSAH